MIIKRAALQAALQATTPDDTRYFMTGVQAEPAKHRLAAIDGHILLIVTDRFPEQDADFPTTNGAIFKGDPATPIVIPLDAIKAMIGTMPKKPTIPILGCAQLSAGETEATATITATDLTAPRTATITRDEQGKFPNYEGLMPKADREVVRVCLAAEVLERLCKAAKLIGNGRSNPTITFDVPIGKGDREKGERTLDPATGQPREGAPGAVVAPVGITITGDTLEITGLAMPCRV